MFKPLHISVDDISVEAHTMADILKGLDFAIKMLPLVDPCRTGHHFNVFTIDNDRGVNRTLFCQRCGAVKDVTPEAFAPKASGPVAS